MILPGDLDNNLLCFESGQGIYILYIIYSSILKRDSVILTFDMPPLARGWELCDIDSLYSRKINKNWEVPARQN